MVPWQEFLSCSRDGAQLEPGLFLAISGPRGLSAAIIMSRTSSASCNYIPPLSFSAEVNKNPLGSLWFMREQDRAIGVPQSTACKITYSTFTAPENVVLIYWIFPKQHNRWHPVLLAILMERSEHYKPVADANGALFPFSLPNTWHIWKARRTYLF